MSKTNCINCGAAKDISEIKCPFCGTTYLDFTAIDFSANEPVVCEFVLPFSKDRTIMSMLAIPRLNEISAEPVYVSFNDPFRMSLSAVESYDMNVGVSFIPLSRNGILFQTRRE